MSFNLDPPSGFRGLDPDRPLRTCIRNLPHWRQARATYFVIFHLADALPQAKKSELLCLRREWESKNPLPRTEAAWTEYAKTVFRKVETWMDAGYGVGWFRQQWYTSELRGAILHFHQQRYEIGCFAIMANHCHLVIRPFDEWDLEDELGSIKSIVAKFINRNETRTGELWQQESYDRIIRDAEHLYRIIQHIGADPRMAGLPRVSWDRWINPAWRLLGWDFHDE
jgi:hypothetical protein